MNRVLISGSSGFLGSYLVKEALNNNIDVFQINHLGQTHSNAILCDLSIEIPNISDVEYDVVIHAAGLAHFVPKTKEQSDSFFAVNVEGTINFLKGIEKLSRKPNRMVLISTVSVYGLNEGQNIAENNPLNAKDPYGLSKIEAENVFCDYALKNKIPYLVLRLPLIAGKNPPGNLNKMIKGIISGRYARIGDGSAKKSIVYAGDVAKIALLQDVESGIYNITDGIHPSFKDLEDSIAMLTSKKIKKLPIGIAKFLAKIGDLFESTTKKRFPFTTNTLNKIVKPLTFDDSKFRQSSNFKTTPVLSKMAEIVS